VLVQRQLGTHALEEQQRDDNNYYNHGIEWDEGNIEYCSGINRGRGSPSLRETI